MPSLRIQSAGTSGRVGFVDRGEAEPGSTEKPPKVIHYLRSSNWRHFDLVPALLWVRGAGAHYSKLSWLSLQAFPGAFDVSYKKTRPQIGDGIFDYTLHFEADAVVEMDEEEEEQAKEIGAENLTVTKAKELYLDCKAYLKGTLRCTREPVTVSRAPVAA